MESVAKKSLLIAFEKGYTVDKFGVVYYKNRIINLSVNDNGYYYFPVNVGKSISKHVRVHRLQGYQKFGNEIFTKKVRHLNGDCKDNSYENIGIGSQSDNMLDKHPDKRIELALIASSKKIVFTKMKLN